MKQMKVPRGTARASRRIGLMAPPSAAAQVQMAAVQAALNVKMGIALFHKHGNARLPF
jgi:hypothetical protein